MNSLVYFVFRVSFGWHIFEYYIQLSQNLALNQGEISMVQTTVILAGEFPFLSTIVVEMQQRVWEQRRPRDSDMRDENPGPPMPSQGHTEAMLGGHGVMLSAPPCGWYSHQERDKGLKQETQGTRTQQSSE